VPRVHAAVTAFKTPQFTGPQLGNPLVDQSTKAMRTRSRTRGLRAVIARCIRANKCARRYARQRAAAAQRLDLVEGDAADDVVGFFRDLDAGPLKTQVQEMEGDESTESLLAFIDDAAAQALSVSDEDRAQAERLVGRLDEPCLRQLNAMSEDDVHDLFSSILSGKARSDAAKTVEKQVQSAIDELRHFGF